MIEIVTRKIDHRRLVPEEAPYDSGATVLFLGTAREFTDTVEGRLRTCSLEYEAHVDMATAQFEKLITDAKSRWPILAYRIVHRLGPIALGETCVAILVSCPHRKQAFDAAAWLMDRTKETVPIWKKEHWADGASEWIHPDENSVK